MGKKSLKQKDPFAEREAQKYAHPIPSRELILDYLAERGSPATYRHIAKELDISEPEEQEALRRRLIAMIRDGQLHQNRRGAYGPIEKMELICGRIIGHKDGFGFVEPESGEEDLFLSPRQMRQVFPNDKVLVRIAGIDNRGRKEAVIVEVIERNTHTLVGRYITKSNVAFFEPANQKICQDIVIAPQEKESANDGQMVILQITSQPTATTRAIGQVISVLGDHMAPGMEIDVAIHNHGIPYLWPDEATREAEHFSAEVKEEEIIGREDLRTLPFVTIDGEDAKDFDDAVYCRPRPDGGFQLYVAIADVSYYVKPGTALDQEALNRGNSVYFPERVIPMLPEILSNELCSLRPNINRLAMVCEMTITATGKISRYHFSEAVIRSHARLTYNQVYAMIYKNDEILSARFLDLLPHLNHLFELFGILRKARALRGTIDFDLPETKIIFGAGRKIEQIIPSERNDAHRMIEECMLCANISASQFLLKNDCPALYRVHEGPSTEKLEDLKRFLKEMGLKLPGRSQPTPSDYARLLDSVVDRPDAHLIQTVLLRSLSQAVYSPENKGHFGLAFDAYTHFTSPIRRFPDLLVHRAIRRVLQRQFQPGEKDIRFEKYGEHCSMTERRADEATREAISWLKCEFMLDKLGEEFQGVIAGVTHFGFFVELAKIYVEGLIHISALQNDYYRFDPIKHCLYGERTGKRYRLGDVVHVKVVRVDLDSRQIDLALVEPLEKSKKNPLKKIKKKRT
jgi:ribonuclease R